MNLSDKVYTIEEIESHISNLLKIERSHGCFGEVEFNYPSEDNIKSANIIIQLLNTRKENA